MFQVILKNPDGTAAPGETVSVSVQGNFRSGFRLTNNFTSDDNGIVHFTIVDLDDVEGSVSIRVSSFCNCLQNWKYSDSFFFYTRSYPLHYFLILILEKEPVFCFSMLSAKQGGLNPGPPALDASTIPLGYRGGGSDSY